MAGRGARGYLRVGQAWGEVSGGRANARRTIAWGRRGRRRAGSRVRSHCRPGAQSWREPRSIMPGRSAEPGCSCAGRHGGDQLLVPGVAGQLQNLRRPGAPRSGPGDGPLPPPPPRSDRASAGRCVPKRPLPPRLGSAPSPLRASSVLSLFRPPRPPGSVLNPDSSTGHIICYWHTPPRHLDSCQPGPILSSRQGQPVLRSQS